MSSEKSQQFNLASEKKSDSVIEKANNFVKTPLGKWVVGTLVFIVVGSGIAAERYLNRDKAENEATNTPPQQEQQVIAPTNETVVDPSNNGASTEQINTPETNEALPTVESLEIDASLMLNPEELEKTFSSRITDLSNSGATYKNAQAAMASEASLSEYAKKIASPYDEAYIEALFIEDWESVPSLVEFVERIKDIHDDTLRDYFKTSFPNYHEEDKVPYRRWEEVVEIVSAKTNQPESWIVIDAIEVARDNAKDNRIQMEEHGGGLGEVRVNSTTKYVVEKNKIKVASISNIIK